MLWDSTYESSPGDSLSRTLIDDEIRRMKLAIRERMEIEHYFGSGVDTGAHIPGGTSVMDKGNAAAMAALTNPMEGSLFLLTDGSDLQIHCYISGVWTQLSTLDHSALSGTADNDHPDLLLKTGVMSGNLNMGGNKLITNGTGSTFGNFLLYGHKSEVHSIDNVAAFKNDSVGQGELNIVQTEVTQTVANHGRLHVSLSAFDFCPQIYAKTAPTQNIFITLSNTLDYGIDVYNHSGAPVEIRVRQERIA